MSPALPPSIEPVFTTQGTHMFQSKGYLTLGTQTLGT